MDELKIQGGYVTGIEVEAGCGQTIEKVLHESYKLSMSTKVNVTIKDINGIRVTFEYGKGTS